MWTEHWRRQGHLKEVTLKPYLEGCVPLGGGADALGAWEGR